jgi:hypothetical protein
MVVVDTEEEFDWSAALDRGSVGVGHMQRIGELQAVFDRHGLRPVYAVGTPIATTPLSIAALQPILRDGRALIGAHLHPWLTPPLTEAMAPRNSFPGNLPKPLEAAKLTTLTGQVEAAFGVRPVIYKAGRYGVGPNSFAILESLGYRIDISPRPPFDYRGVEGPDFSRRGNEPRWEGPGRTILSIPNSGAFIGPLARPGWEWIGDVTQSPLSRRLRLPGLLARLGMLERVALTPEGHSLAELRALVRFATARGQRHFMLSLHSPSIAPGCTPYVRDEAEQAAFLDQLDRFVAWFRREMQGEPDDPLRLYDELSATRQAPVKAGASRHSVTVQPILVDDLPQLAGYWRTNLNAAIPTQDWISAFRHDWLPAPPNRGFKLIADGKLVGTLGAIYSRQIIGGEEIDFCNLTSMVVENEYRPWSMDLLSALLSQKQFRFTNFTPTPAVANMLRLFRFRPLRAGERLIFHRLPPPFAQRARIVTGAERLGLTLTGDAARLWRDHRGIPWLRCFAAGREDEWCVIFWRPSVIKGLPAARILGFNDPALFLRWHATIGSHLLLRHGAFGMRIMEHLLPDESAIGIRREMPMPRLYRGPPLADEHVSLLYSELVALPL